MTRAKQAERFLLFSSCGAGEGLAHGFEVTAHFLLDNLFISYSIGKNKNLSDTNTMTKLALLLLLLSELPMTVADKGSVY